MCSFCKQSWLQGRGGVPEKGTECAKRDVHSALAGNSGLPVESVPEALPLACSSALMSCRSAYEGATLGLLVSSECVVQLLSEVKGHLFKESKEGHVQQGMVNVRAENR